MEWNFKINDDMSNPMRGMGAELTQLNSNIAASTKEIDKMERAMGLEALKAANPMAQQLGYMKLYREDLQRAKAASDDAGEHGFFKKLFGAEGFFASEMIAKVVEFTHKIIEWGVELVEAGARAAEFKEEALGTFSVMTGGADAAEEEFERLQELARGTSMTKSQVMGQYRELFSFAQAYGTKAAEDVISAGADIQKLLGTGAQQAFIGTVKNIEAMGGLNERMIKQLKDVGVATPEKLYEALSKQLNTSVKGVQKLIKAGQVSKEVSINALLDLVSTNINKGEGVGFYALEKSAASVEDQLKNLKESAASVFEGVNTGPMAQALKGLSDAFEGDTESGKQMRAVVKEAFDDITASVQFVHNHMEAFLTVAKGVLWTLERIAAIGKGVSEIAFIATTGHSYEAAKQIEKDQAAKEAAAKADIDRNNMLIEEMQAKLNAKLASNENLEASTEKFATSGENAGRAFHDKFIEGADMAGASDDLHNIWKQANQEHSPSKLWEEHGSNSAQGFSRGFSANINLPGIGNGGGFGPGAFSGAAAPQAGAGGGTTIQISIENKFAGGAPSSPEQQSEVNDSMRQSMRNAALQLFAELRHG